MRILFFFLFTIYTFFSFGQVDRCSTDEYVKILKQKGLYKNQKKILSSQQSVFNGNYVIPVVVHVLYNNEEQNISDERIYSQIETLNQDYSASNIELENVPEEFENVVGNVGISFCLVQTDLHGNSFSGINRVYTEIEAFNMSDDAMKKSDQGGVDVWDSANYLNFWVCNLSGNLLGFATMPGDVSADLDGVVIDYEYFGVNTSSQTPYNLGRTGTHEVGHYLNLEHTFYAGCSDWDGCDDTPAISSPTYGCPDDSQESCSTIDMTMNYMDYTNDACMYMFTICQANLMVDALLNYRPDLISYEECSVSIEDNIIDAKDVLIYPNPVSNKIIIDVKNTDVNIYDIYGREVLSKHIFDDSCLDISLLKPGSYFLSFDHHVSKFIKK